MRLIFFFQWLLLLACLLNNVRSAPLSRLQWNAEVNIALNNVGQDPDFNRNVTQILTSRNYPVEEHTVVTADGFMLGVQRITGPKNSVGVVNKIPVLVLHGLLDSSAAWVLNTEEESLAYLLANAGFDVWLGNSRGNFYSRKHKIYNPSQSEFWDFSFDDMALYDIPAMVNYVINQTGVPSIGYVGHSQGTTQMFAALSLFPDTLGKQINIFNALAPVTYVGHQTSILVSALAKFRVDLLFEFFGVKEFLPSSDWIHSIGYIFCTPFPELCEDFIFLLCGWDSDPERNLNATRMPVFISHTPAGTSVKNMVHWASAVRNNGFGFFDYGTKEENLKHYNSTVPPTYNLTNINTPMSFFTGTNDALGDPTDFVRTLNAVRHDLVVFTHNEDQYEHLDETWGLDCHLKIYPDVIRLLTQYAWKSQAQQENNIANS